MDFIIKLPKTSNGHENSGSLSNLLPLPNPDISSTRETMSLRSRGGMRHIVRRRHISMENASLTRSALWYSIRKGWEENGKEITTILPLVDFPTITVTCKVVTGHLTARSGTDLKMAKLAKGRVWTKFTWCGGRVGWSRDQGVAMGVPLKKQGRDRSSSSTFALPQEFKIGETSLKISLEHHEEQIEEILNHLDELSLNRIEHIEDKIKGLKNGWQMGNNNKIALARFRIANLEQIIEDIQTRAAIKKLVSDSVFATLKAQAANMANTDNTTRPREAPVARQCSYKEFMSCQPINFKDMEGAVSLIR
ncbi:hypothetical protein Tco_1194633 [Tanacetum coccineum]